jgi:hypothetical protein
VLTRRATLRLPKHPLGGRAPFASAAPEGVLDDSADAVSVPGHGGMHLTAYEVFCIYICQLRPPGDSPQRRPAPRIHAGTELVLPAGMNSLPIAYWLFLSALVLGSVLGVGALLGGVDVDTDVEADLDADVDADIEGDMDADASAEGDGSGSAEAHGGGFWAALGVGRVPLGLLVALDLLLFGGLGVIGAESLTPWLARYAAATLWLPVALVGGVWLGARVARFVARRLPTEETYAVSRDALIGRIARAELDVDARFGRAKVIDDGGALHFVRCRSTGPRIAAGTELVLTDRDPETGVYTAVAADLMGRDSAHTKPC